MSTRGLILVIAALLLPGATGHAQDLSAAESAQIATAAAAEAQRLGLAAHVAVVDREGRPLAVFRMPGAPATSRTMGQPGLGLGGMDLPADLVALTKAATGALLSSDGNAFSTRTGSFIVQEHFPPGIDFTPGGPLFGVQLSSLPCSDVRTVPLGLSGDPGGLPLYRNGRLVGGVGVEGDGVYGIDRDVTDHDQPPEERAAAAGAAAFPTPGLIRADQILADGIRLPFSESAAGPAAPPAPGAFVLGPVDTGPSPLGAAAVGGFAVEGDPRFPIRGGSRLAAADVERILAQGVAQAARTRAAIRQPLGSAAHVTYAVTDVDGRVLGVVRDADAPGFGLDVAVQKARTAGFFSSPGAGEALRTAGLGAYVAEIPLDGRVALSSRAVGFLAQPFFPPGIPDTEPGPFSVPEAEWSPFHTGLHLDLVIDALLGRRIGSCSAIPGLGNGITIFPGGLPLFRDGQLVGAVGISGDGVDQDDLIAAAASAGFDAPEDRRSDQVVIRGVRLPYVKFPRHPEL